MDVEHEGGSLVAASPSSSETHQAKQAPLVLRSSSTGDAASGASLELETTTTPIASDGVRSELESPPALPSTGSSPLAFTARNYDVYIGMFGKEPWLVRYAKWMQAELETKHSLACLSADRSNLDPRNFDIAGSVLHSASHGVVLVTRKSFRNPYTIEELTIFLSRGNLLPVFFDVDPADCHVQNIVARQGEAWELHGGELWKMYRGEEKAWLHAVQGLLTVEARRVEAHLENWKDSIQRVAALVTNKELGVAEEELDLPWPRNGYFAGREKELKEMERILFPDVELSSSSETNAQTLARKSDASSKAETELESEVGRRFDYDIENHEDESPKEIVANQQRGSKDGNSSGSLSGLSLLDRRIITRTGRSHREPKRRNSTDHQETQSPFAASCVLTGISGIGKSELAVEFAYRHSQKYGRVLWVGGECRYLRQNYLNLSTALGVDVGAENTTRPLHEQESSAVHKLRQELEKDIPCLLIIDNVDASRDSLDGRALRELLPRSAAHVIITTRLRRVMYLESVEITFLSPFEALSLMRGGKHQSETFSVQQIDKLKELETKLEQLPFGLAIVGRIMNEFKLKPSELLAEVVTMNVTQTSKQPDPTFGSNPYLVKLLDVCFHLMNGGGLVKNCMAMRVAYVGGWFAPTACPIELLAAAAKKLAKKMGGVPVQTQFVKVVMSCWGQNANARSGTVDAGARLLMRLGLARAAPRDGGLYFPDVVQAYCRMRGGVAAARCFVRAICKSGSIVQHYDHFWAAVYLVFRDFGSDMSAASSPPAPVPVLMVVVEFQVPDLIVFTRALVLPLALRAFNAFSRCTAALEILRLCFVMLDDAEKSYVAGIQDPLSDQSLCWCRRNSGTSHQVVEYVWQDLTLLKAAVLESRAKLMLRGGQLEAGEELCRTCISIRTVMLGAGHADTLAAQQTLSKFSRARSR